MLLLNFYFKLHIKPLLYFCQGFEINKLITSKQLGKYLGEYIRHFLIFIFKIDLILFTKAT